MSAPHAFYLCLIAYLSVWLTGVIVICTYTCLPQTLEVLKDLPYTHTQAQATISFWRLNFSNRHRFTYTHFQGRMAAFAKAFQQQHGKPKVSPNKEKRLEADPTVTTAQLQRTLEAFCDLQGCSYFESRLICMTLQCAKLLISWAVTINAKASMSRVMTCGH